MPGHERGISRHTRELRRHREASSSSSSSSSSSNGSFEDEDDDEDDNDNGERGFMSNTILVVDDQPHIVRLIQVNLEKEGYQVFTASDGEEGMQKVRQVNPDLVILDVIMPRKDGFEVL